MSSLERSRKTRSHSLKPLTPPSLLTQRSKRTLSLPNKAIVPPLINIQRYYDQDENFNDQKGENYLDTRDEISCMAWYTPVVGLSCSLAMYFWSCALAYYATSWFDCWGTIKETYKTFIMVQNHGRCEYHGEDSCASSEIETEKICSNLPLTTNNIL